MTKEEAARILGPATTRELRKNADHFRDLTKMVPLTLEQLREMDGQPVWVKPTNEKEYADVSGWCVCLDGRVEVPGVECFAWRFENYGSEWIAYPYPPVHIEREAWKGCQLCNKSDYISGSATATTEFLGGKFLSRCKGEFSFCPCCGKPLTESAWAELEKRLRGGRA